MLRVGDILYGFCGGHFGRDSYDGKVVVAIGSDWVVARELDAPSFPVFAAVEPERLEEYKVVPLLLPEEYH